MTRPVTEQIFGGTPWPPGRMRLELRQLRDDLRAWGTYRHDDVADAFRFRANRVLLHLRSQPDGRHRRLPPEFAFTGDEYTPGAHTVTAEGASRLETFVGELADLLPGGGVEARTALSLAPLHPVVQSAAGRSWQAGDLFGAAEAARDAVLARLRRLLGPACPDGEASDGDALVAASLDAGVVCVGAVGGPEQEAVRALARGLVSAVRALPGTPPERTGADRVYELLALASLVLHRLEFAERRRPTPGSRPGRPLPVPPEQRIHLP